ncbi:hypothetical protein [Mycobacterium sp. GA-2829]|uniref:hypothetical protein n=1 Tax=Mycobacterium sp. GA-2829 TaxID=1772283 RepID=UPI000B0F1F45|nr:hypothetical protein [Mycobacterium sp. GA-2829]
MRSITVTDELDAVGCRFNRSILRPALVIGVREVHPAEQLSQETALDAGLGDERGDDRRATWTREAFEDCCT